ncbi:MAG: hypothetical protein LH650_07535 [Chloroflexi bacterium]|nr:hypothetical protein [Chloroflexota bacterium]
MSSETIRQAVAGATAYLPEHPVEARYRDSVATAVLREGLVVDVTGPTGETVTTDMSTSDRWHRDRSLPRLAPARRCGQLRRDVHRATGGHPGRGPGVA